ncbi:MAG: LemA family protein [Gammaproteobacteria bacterium]|jgi:LemA protein|nr:LemA family protein [Gammaproteobacteria bacterium]MDP6652584.1 LemA family protein [Gammaproteobacteria bacterium]|tara:strand:+ start:190 stop:597 length:408 start_codon:yes stop_codon:yes gene_type:complete
MPTFLLVGIVVLAFVIWVFSLLVKDRNQVLAAWSDIDVQLKRRHDLVPQLVTTVKAYADFEQATMTAVAELRSRSESATHLPEKAALEDEMVSAIGKLVVLAEDYPDLKADTNFRQLQSELTEIEDSYSVCAAFL